MDMTPTIDISAEARAWVGNYEMLKSLAPASPEVTALRDAAMAEFARLGFPTTKHEEWKYTSLRSLATGSYMPAFRPVQTDIDASSGAFYDRVLPAGLSGEIVVLVNGHFDEGLSRISSGAKVSSLKSAIAAGDEAVLAHLGKVAGYEGRALVALNTAVASDGVVAHFPKGKSAASPLIIVHLSVGSNAASNSRTLVIAEDLSEGKVVEIFFNWGSGPNWGNHVSEILVGEGANLEWVTIQNDLGSETALTHFTQVHQGANSTFRSAVMSSAGQLVRNDLQVLHQGSGCNTYLNGLTLLDGNSHVDHHTLVDHALPHCYSNETYKIVLDGNSTGVFNGKVMVRPDAQKTNAFQSNKTLLLSDGATVNAKPQLEIFADDVKCSHGATTGRLDETALFYLRSRGLSAKRAQALLTYAFGAEVLDQIGIAEVREHLEAQLLERLTGEGA